MARLRAAANFSGGAKSFLQKAQYPTTTRDVSMRSVMQTPNEASNVLRNGYLLILPVKRLYAPTNEEIKTQPY